jgi:hypothetical protein
MGDFQKSVDCINILIQKFPSFKLTFSINAMGIYRKLGDSEKEQQLLKDCWGEA